MIIFNKVTCKLCAWNISLVLESHNCQLENQVNDYSQSTQESHEATESGLEGVFTSEVELHLMPKNILVSYKRPKLLFQIEAINSILNWHYTLIK
jgi:hypothetical protein